MITDYEINLWIDFDRFDGGIDGATAFERLFGPSQVLVLLLESFLVLSVVEGAGEAAKNTSLKKFRGKIAG